MELLINLLSGAVGGNVLGKLSKGKTLINTLLGLIGGGIGNFVGPDILSQLGVAAEAGEAGPAGASAGIGGLLAMIAGIFNKNKGKQAE